MSNNPNAAIVAGVPKSFLFAIVGGGMGVYFGRRKAKLQEKSTVNLAVNTDSAPVASNVRTQEELTEVQSVAQKPQLVVTAIFLLWASLAIGVVKMLLDFSYLSGVASAAFTNFILIFTFVLIAFLISKISVGRNWARITFLFIFIIGVLPILPIVLGEFSRSAVVGALSVAQIGLQVYALFLLFTLPCSSWFRKTVDA